MKAAPAGKASKPPRDGAARRGTRPVAPIRRLRSGVGNKTGALTMRIPRLFTDHDRSPYATVEFRTACSEIRNPDGSVVFRQDDVEVPAAWSQVACDVLAQKYFRRA